MLADDVKIGVVNRAIINLSPLYHMDRYRGNPRHKTIAVIASVLFNWVVLFIITFAIVESAVHEKNDHMRYQYCLVNYEDGFDQCNHNMEAFTVLVLCLFGSFAIGGISTYHYIVRFRSYKTKW